jgi:hypothetical protein
MKLVQHPQRISDGFFEITENLIGLIEKILTKDAVDDLQREEVARL